MAPKILTPEEWKDLLDRSGIVFERPIDPRRWPRGYRRTFGVIRDIGRQWMEEYVRTMEFDILPLQATQVRVNELIQSARECITTFKDEGDWRMRIEPKVFSRFESEVICRKCRDHLWSSDFGRCAEDEDVAERQRYRRKSRALCQCTAFERSMADKEDEGKRPLFFEFVIEPFIQREPVDDSEPKKKRPDRVIGLNTTRTIDERIKSDRFRTLNHAPFTNKNVLYPYLVFEAKREKGPGPGWSSVEHQTAFPIQACLRLQQSLQQKTGVNLQCLVWFFASKGEEWRLYGAIPDGNTTRIFDLWHGTILSNDGALQLLLIVDYICTWARSQYREEVLACLAQGSGLSRRFTSPLPSQFGDADFDTCLQTGCRLSIEPIPPNGHVSEPGHRSLGGSAEILDVLVDSRDHRQIVSELDAYNWLRFIRTTAEAPPWTRTATIRHANMVQLVFHEITLPDDDRSLRTALGIYFPDSDVKAVAGRLLNTLLENSICSTTVEEMVGTRYNKPPYHARTFIYLQTRMRPEDWQIQRYLLRIHFTSLWELKTVAAQQAVDFRKSDAWQPHNCQRLNREVEGFKMLSGREGLDLAMLPLSKSHMCMKLLPDANGEEHFKAQKFHPGQLGQLTNADLQALRKGISSRSGLAGDPTDPLFKVPFHTTQPLIAEVSGQDPGKKPCLIIRKRTSWPLETPEFCLWTLVQDVDFNDNIHLGCLVIRALEDNDIVASSRVRTEEQDKSMLRQWSRILLGELPADWSIR